MINENESKGNLTALVTGSAGAGIIVCAGAGVVGAGVVGAGAGIIVGAGVVGAGAGDLKPRHAVIGGLGALAIYGLSLGNQAIGRYQMEDTGLRKIDNGAIVERRNGTEQAYTNSTNGVDYVRLDDAYLDSLMESFMEKEQSRIDNMYETAEAAK